MERHADTSRGLVTYRGNRETYGRYLKFHGMFPVAGMKAAMRMSPHYRLIKTTLRHGLKAGVVDDINGLAMQVNIYKKTRELLAKFLIPALTNKLLKQTTNHKPTTATMNNQQQQQPQQVPVQQVPQQQQQVPVQQQPQQPQGGGGLGGLGGLVGGVTGAVGQTTQGLGQGLGQTLSGVGGAVGKTTEGVGNVAGGATNAVGGALGGGQQQQPPQ